ncbi:MAG: 3-oxoacyl-ACP synthase [Gammaproteobacteria bacterium]|nr:3-oxoacyl-ACP synthase [Gammaproteobacteria bacterium]
MNAKRTRKSSTNWEQVDALKDDEIDTSEIPALDASFFEAAELRMPRVKQSVTMRLDADILDWYKAQGKGYQTRINAVLRLYMEAQNGNAA